MGRVCQKKCILHICSLPLMETPKEVARGRVSQWRGAFVGLNIYEWHKLLTLGQSTTNWFQWQFYDLINWFQWQVYDLRWSMQHWFLQCQWLIQVWFTFVLEKVVEVKAIFVVFHGFCVVADPMMPSKWVRCQILVQPCVEKVMMIWLTNQEEGMWTCWKLIINSKVDFSKFC